MPDISMCCNEFCEKRNECYRYRATPNSTQSYTNFFKMCNLKIGYEMFIQINKGDVCQ